MKVTELDEHVIQDIGHAFGYYDCGQEHGLIDAFPSRDAAADFICGYVRMALQGVRADGGVLHLLARDYHRIYRIAAVHHRGACSIEAEGATAMPQHRAHCFSNHHNKAKHQPRRHRNRQQTMELSNRYAPKA